MNTVQTQPASLGISFRPKLASQTCGHKMRYDEKPRTEQNIVNYDPTHLLSQSIETCARRAAIRKLSLRHAVPQEKQL